jgi:hypothetical protein
MPKLTESQIQIQFFDYVRHMAKTNLDYQMIVANPHQGGGGIQNILRGKKMQKEGASKGFPDISVLVPRGKYHGLFIELKRPGGHLAPEQANWLNMLKRQGYDTSLVKTDNFLDIVNRVNTYLYGQTNT